jgi:hypothetical protein
MRWLCGAAHETPGEMYSFCSSRALCVEDRVRHPSATLRVDEP